MDYETRAKESDIIERYREKREREEITVLMDTTSPDFPAFYQEAIHNIEYVPKYGEYWRKELIKAFAEVDGLYHFDATISVVEAYAAWQAEILVSREIEDMSVGEMMRRLDKREDVINHDVITLVRLGGTR